MRHIRAHSGLSGPLHEKNVLADTLTKVIALNLHKKIDKAKNSHKIHHQNTAGLRYKFHIPARCVTNLWERVCLYFSSRRRFANLDPRQIRHVTVPQTPNPWRTYSLARRPPASSHLRATSHTPHPPHYTPRPRAKKVCAGSKGQKRERAHGVQSRPTRPRRREENAPSPGSG